MTTMDRTRAKFDDLRAKYMVAEAKRREQEVKLRVRYGGDYKDSWLSAGEHKEAKRLRAAAEKAGDMGARGAHLRGRGSAGWRAAQRGAAAVVRGHKTENVIAFES